MLHLTGKRCKKEERSDRLNEESAMEPESQITAYLFAHKSTLEFSTIDQVVKDVKLSVFYSMPPISDDEIRKIVVQWATFNAVGLLLSQPTVNPLSPPVPGAPPAAFESELIDSVKKAISAVSGGVTFGKAGDNINIGVTGATRNFKTGEQEASIGISWGGTLKLDAASGPFHFSGTLSKDSWDITLSFPQETYIPDLSLVGNVITKGVGAIEKMAQATRGFTNISDAAKIGALIKPYATALQDAVEAVSGIAKANRKGGPSFGFKLGSPEPTPGMAGMPSGVQGSVVFTYVF
jgi:hypothetical protein